MIRTWATQRRSARETWLSLFYVDVLGANTLLQASDTSECSICLIGVLRCDEFLSANEQTCHRHEEELHTAFPRKSRVLAFLSLFSDGR